MAWTAHRRQICAWLTAMSLSAPCWGQNQAAPVAAPAPESPLFTQPTTAEGHFEAALFMARLARLDLAKHHLEQVLAAAPSDDLLIALRDKHGTGKFLELAGKEELNPPATELLNLLTSAVRRRIQSPGYADGLLLKLIGSSRDREEAVTELRHLGSYAVAPLLKALDGKLGVERDILAVTLARLGSNAIDPLIGALQSPDPNVRSVAAEGLGLLGSPDEMVWLWHAGFADSQPPGVQQAARRSLARLKYGSRSQRTTVDPYGTADLVLATAVAYLDGSYQWSERLDEDQQISVWTWDNSLGTVAEHPVSRRYAAIHFAERLAREAAELAPERQDPQIVLLATLLTRDVERTGWDQPFPKGPGTALQFTVQAGPETASAVLRLALDRGLTAAAIGAVNALAMNGSVHLLQKPRGESAIIDALNAPHPRIQFAAATAILHWEPTQPFRDSGRVVEILARTLNADDRAAGVVCDPNISRGTVTAGVFGELGFRPVLAATGMDGFRVAASRGNIELAVLHPNVIRWELSQTLANLKADARTAGIPVVIYGPGDGREHYERIAAGYRNVVFVQQGDSALEVNGELRPLLAQISPPPLSPEQRGAQIQEAAFWLRRIATSNVGHVFDLSIAEDSLSSAVNHPNVAADALIALGSIGRPSVQELYAKTSTASAISAPIRELAALQLAFHIQKFGPLLREGDLTLVETTWRSEADPAVQSALGAVIGSLKPSSQSVRKELLAVPMSPAPIGSPNPGAPKN